jgi:hypothetical protein
MMSDEEVFAEEEIAGGDGQELGGKTGLIPAVVLRLLKWVALGLGAVIFIVTIVVVTVGFLNKGPQNVVYPSDSPEYSEVPDILQWYDDFNNVRNEFFVERGILAKEKEFVINLTTEELLFATDYCGVKSGVDIDKFKEMKLTKESASIVGCPMIAEAPVSIECKVFDVREFPTHDMFMAEIVAVHAKEELMEESGRLALEKAGLICFSHGEYMGLNNKRLGTFGYSIMKPKTKKRKEKEQSK